jgi:uncharacterized membrane protein YebE (DUF533 family)
MNHSNASSLGAESDAANSIRRAVDWLLLPVSAGAIANVAAVGVASALGGSGAKWPLIAACAAVAGSSLVKYFSERSAQDEAQKPR